MGSCDCGGVRTLARTGARGAASVVALTAMPLAGLLVLMLLVVQSPRASAQEQSASASFAALAQTCAPHVDVTTLAALVRVESGFNPYAIGVVGAHLQSQPRSYAEAVATARALAARGYNFSVGLGQVNVRNLARVGESLVTIFEPCRNLRASSAILQQCFARSSAHVAQATRTMDPQRALRDALSCYYSGNFQTGYRQGYVASILAGAYTNLRLARAQEARANAAHSTQQR
jgi:type IV secretion system protein VirB1